ncbi:DUF2889 domain-containing protein [Variovorax sp. J22P240]|uniref:DUF2889 domain-containing protein n=1 Tax=Variovorax sp. J22P240 TaxID=3053514 RepID=UPI002577607C|nr:DUF2889 domain-containing protein [Variovorax sp. J22P240]MDM0002578.1 DUF2889 domain-containing protein [Variovorax sp. J22P240]
MAAQGYTRVPIHLRDVSYRTFLRKDELWDIEGSLLDTKGYDQMATERGPLAAGDPIHKMKIRLTIDDDFVIREVSAEMEATPFGECQQAKAPLEKLIGRSIKSGWRKVIAETMGGEAGCTHLRELLFGMGTAAFQTVGRYRMHQRRLAGIPEKVMATPKAPLGECLGWAFDGEPVRRYRPEFFGWRPPETPTSGR